MNLYSLGIEFGSTRIKAVLVDSNGEVELSSVHEWENELVEGMWTYSITQIENGLQDAYQKIAFAYEQKFSEKLTELESIGISAMMHGYLALDENNELLVPFRTWRNTNTDRASRKLSELFQFNIPHRWSVAHVYEVILNEENHLSNLNSLHTLASYVHYRLTGEHVIGVGDAAGMFPIDKCGLDYDKSMLEAFSALPEVQKHNIELYNLLPTVLPAGKAAGRLSSAGAKLLDPSGELSPGVLFAPPEGDAGTGMVATNSLIEKSGNISVGTSVFSMMVLEKPLENYYPEVDIVTTPEGKLVAMIHCNNGTSEIDAWVRLFKQTMEHSGNKVSMTDAYEFLYNKALEAEKSAGGIVSVNFLAGEPIAKVNEAQPLYTRSIDSSLTLENFMLSQIYSIFSTLKLGMKILEGEEVVIDNIVAHGGVFKTEGVMQTILASILGTSVSVYRSAGEGGAWGMAVLAAYSASKAKGYDGDLVTYVNGIFENQERPQTIQPDEQISEGFEKYLNSYIEIIKKYN